MDKKTYPITAQVISMSEPQSFTRKNKPDFVKVELGLVTSDNQRLYCEVRNNKISMLKDIDKGNIIQGEFIFAGSEKNGKQYNNIYLVNIEKV